MADKIEQQTEKMENLKKMFSHAPGNEENKVLRESFEELLKFIKDNPKPAADSSREKVEEYARMLLNRLDAVERNSYIYADAKEGASPGEEKERPAGVKECGDFAKEQKELLLADMKKRGLIGANDDVDSLRNVLATNKMMDSFKALQQMKELPSDEKGKREILNLAADIIVGRVVSGDNTAGQKMLEEYGIIGVKRKVALNKDFQRYLENCITNKEMTGKQLAEELTGDKVMPKVKSVKTDMEKENAQSAKTPKSPHIGK